MTFDELQNNVYDEVIFADDIAAEISKLLSGLNRGDVFVVHRLAKDTDAAIARELARKDGDMVDVVRSLGAVLEPTTNWLKSQGVKPRLLRATKPIVGGH
jgi:hypothetical protein